VDYSSVWYIKPDPASRFGFEISHALTNRAEMAYLGAKKQGWTLFIPPPD
jgi:hypothetical protein